MSRRRPNDQASPEASWCVKARSTPRSSRTTAKSAACRSTRGWSPLSALGRRRARAGLPEDHQGQIRRPGAADRGHRRKNLVLALGPAGTGKTYLAIAKAVEALEAGKVGRIVLSRPAVEAGESIGFLPGEMEDKLAPYLRPLYDALSDRLSMKRVRALMAEGAIEIAPVGFMRGRTLNNAFVVIDEAQNCTYVQLKMLLTRLGWNSTMVVTGDPAPVRPAARALRPGATWPSGSRRWPTSRWCAWPTSTSSATRWWPACWACFRRLADQVSNHKKPVILRPPNGRTGGPMQACNCSRCLGPPDRLSADRRMTKIL